MTCQFFLFAFVAILILAGASAPAWAAQLEVLINPDTESSPFHIRYQKTVFIEYPEDGLIHDQLNGQNWQVTGSADSSNPGVQGLMDQMNRNMLDSGSWVSISDLVVSYDMHLRPFDGHTSIDYNVILNGDISNYVITKDSQMALIDLGWRGLSAYDDVIIDGTEINMPVSILESYSPRTHELLVGTAAGDVLLQPIINADFILEWPMTNWYFLFDPMGIGVDAGTLDLSNEMADHAVSTWHISSECCLNPSPTHREFETIVTLDREYTIKIFKPADNAIVRVMGFGSLDTLDGVEVAGVTPTVPEGFTTTTTSTGAFPFSTGYNIFGLVIIAGIAFFLVRRWLRKRQSVRHR